jgi:hypothetical protein
MTPRHAVAYGYSRKSARETFDERILLEVRITFPTSYSLLSFRSLCLAG